jgi:BlaI family penicillinase repressor
MKPVPRITDTEWEIMRVIWAGAPITASEIIERLAVEDPSWHPKTVRTLLGRLLHKGALRYQAAGRRYVYEPLVTERECIAAASDTFLEKVFGGSLKPMLAHFVEARRLTEADLKDLRSLLDKGGKAGRSRRKGWKA